MENKKYKTATEYFTALPASSRVKAVQMRRAIQQAAPEAEEVISYNMPGYKLNGILVWFAVYKNHIGFYPKTSAIKLFADELKGYKTSKGTIKFPMDKDVPVALVKKIVKYRVKENSAKQK